MAAAKSVGCCHNRAIIANVSWLSLEAFPRDIQRKKFPILLAKTSTKPAQSHLSAKLLSDRNSSEWEPSMGEVTTIGLDLAKHVSSSPLGGPTQVARRKFRRSSAAVATSQEGHRQPRSGREPA